ncbi:hypothetical protein M3Y96_01108900 [Aphelenchoides besseyi]|nr:hypothetical protein M3Y96_01108900 [Aphelenchoides besseyi]
MPRDKNKIKEKDASSRRKKRNKSKPQVNDSSTAREKSKKTTIRRLVRSKDNARKKTNEDHVSTSPAISTTPVSSTPISTTPSTEKNKDDHSTREVAKKQSDSMMGTVFVPVENQHPAVSPASSSSKSRSKKKKKKKTATVDTAETLTKEDPEPADVQLADSSKERTVRKETNPDTAPAVMVVPELKSARELEEFLVKSSKRKKKSTDSHKAKRSVEESPRERPSKAVDEDQVITGDQQQNRDETRRKTSTQNAADTLLADSPQPPTLGNDVLGFSVYAYKNRNNDRENA